MKQFPKQLLHIFQRDPKKQQDSTIQFKNPQRYFVRYALNAGSGWSLDQMRQLKNRQHPTPRELVNSTPNMQCSSHLSALIVSRRANTALQWQYRSCISSMCSVTSKALPESCPPHVRFHDSATVRRLNHTFTSGVSESKTLNTAQSTSKVANLEPKIGSCRVSNGGKTVHWRHARFTRQQC